MKIAFISPFYNIESYSSDLKKAFPDIEMTFYCDDLKTMGQFAAEKENEGFDAIISRGGTHEAISKFLTIPCINSEASVFDLIDTLTAVKKSEEEDCTVKILVYYLNTFLDDPHFVKELEDLFHIKICVCKFSSYQEFDEVFDKFTTDDIILGASHAVRKCKERGYKGYPLDAGYNTMRKSVIEAIERAKARKDDITKKKQLSLMLSYSTDGIMFINDRFVIEMMNPITRKIIKEVFGYHLEEGALLKDQKLLKSIREAMTDRLPLRDLIYDVGTEETILYNVFPITFNDTVSGIIISFREAKEIIQSEKKIRKELNQKGCAAKYNLDDIKGESSAITYCRYLAKKFGMFDSNVLIQGETGTGKELFAQAIHNCSSRIHGPFYGINCATFPENLLESELFGYSDGAFTGAAKGGKAGLFELAHGGTIFLDEIGEMPLVFQNKLLRVLQEKEIRRIGDDKVIPIDTRIIAASHNDLMISVKNGKFREDLFYRLNVLNLVLPSLNERTEDIPSLIRHFMDIYRSKFNISYKMKFNDEAMDCLKRYRWRGNVRELENFVERICVYGDEGKIINAGIVENVLRGFSSVEKNVNKDEKASHLLMSGDVLNEKVYDLIKDAIKRFDGNKSRAANYLGVSRTYIWRKLKEVEKNESMLS